MFRNHLGFEPFFSSFGTPVSPFGQGFQNDCIRATASASNVFGCAPAATTMRQPCLSRSRGRIRQVRLCPSRRPSSKSRLMFGEFVSGTFKAPFAGAHSRCQQNNVVGFCLADDEILLFLFHMLPHRYCRLFAVAHSFAEARPHISLSLAWWHGLVVGIRPSFTSTRPCTCRASTLYRESSICVHNLCVSPGPHPQACPRPGITTIYSQRRVLVFIERVSNFRSHEFWLTAWDMIGGLGFGGGADFEPRRLARF